MCFRDEYLDKDRLSRVQIENSHGVARATLNPFAQHISTQTLAFRNFRLPPTCPIGEFVWDLCGDKNPVCSEPSVLDVVLFEFEH